MTLTNMCQANLVPRASLLPVKSRNSSCENIEFTTLFDSFIYFLLAPEMPRNLTAVATSPHSLRISWKPPAVLNGIIRNYILSLCLMEDGNGNESQHCGTFFTINLQADIRSFNTSDNFTLCK